MIFAAATAGPRNAEHGASGGSRETVLEGDAGFYHAYAGNNKGQLTYSFVGDTHTSLDKITAELGKEWMFLETLYRIYSTARIQHRPTLTSRRSSAKSTTSAMRTWIASRPW